MRLTANTTAFLAAAALGAAAAHLEAAVALLAAPDAPDAPYAPYADRAPATASFHLTTGPVSIALHAAALDGHRDGWPPGTPARAHLAIGVAIPALGLRAVHRVSYAAPARSGDRAPIRLVEALASGRVRAWLSWQAAS
ncbi:hypothetical protein WMF26_07910 [Sorangium sp. So ce185]|uniref:hypothetical protein n=1 Tax=Sorangium sp. So ce185 TaxID=3133287 RepID=UPI003F5DE6FA